jgi:hypothetical protein
MNPFGWGLGANYIGGATYRVTRGEEPEANVRVILYDAQKNAIGETWSDANGDYEFADIEDGTYYINIDIPGVAMEPYEIVLSDELTIEDGLRILNSPNEASIVNLTSHEEFTNAEGLSVFPNPTDRFVQLSMNNSESFDYQLVNLNGAVILTGSSEYSKAQLDLNDLSKGIYFLELTSEKGERYSQKVMLQ